MDFGVFGGLTPEQVQNMRAFMANQQQAQMGPFGGVGGASGLFGFGGAEANSGAPSAEPAGANSQQQNSSPSGTDGAGAGDRGAGDRQDEPPVMNVTHHNGVVCDVCNTEIRGFRYKCMQCPDYDLCGKCEQKGNHAGHIMMRIAFPEQAQSAIRRFMNPSPPPSPRHHGHPFGGHHGHGHGHPGMSHPLFGQGRRGGCRRRSGHESDRSEEEEERPATASGTVLTI